MVVAVVLLASSSINTWVATCGITISCPNEQGMRWDVAVLVISSMIMGVSSVMLGLLLSRYREERSLRRRGSAR